MSKKLTPGEVLNSVAQGINTGDLDSLMTLYEADACFASQPGQLAKSPESVRQSLRSFIDLKGKLDLKVMRVLQASDLALVTTEWSFITCFRLEGNKDRNLQEHMHGVGIVVQTKDKP